ncbi:MAG: mechanosensitive ion channel family protein, partial [Anaerotignaceae bacterium]
IGDKTGVVEDISIRTTQIRSPNGTLHIIPNGGITVVSNMCKEYINAIVEVDVAYEEDLQKVIGILNDEMVIAGKELKEIRTTPIVLGVADLADSGVTIKIIAECDIKQNYNIERELRLRIKNRFDAEGITIPFPQRVVHMAEKKEV